MLQGRVGGSLEEGRGIPLAQKFTITLTAEDHGWVKFSQSSLRWCHLMPWPFPWCWRRRPPTSMWGRAGAISRAKSRTLTGFALIYPPLRPRGLVCTGPALALPMPELPLSSTVWSVCARAMPPPPLHFLWAHCAWCSPVVLDACVLLRAVGQETFSPLHVTHFDITWMGHFIKRESNCFQTD